MFTQSILDALAQRIDSEYPLRHNPKLSPLSYGTAGFRTTGKLLAPVAARVATIAVLRAWACGIRQAGEGLKATCSVGFMVTASHNRAEDNGFKIIDTDGGMLAPSWEHWCTEAANAATGADLEKVVKTCISEFEAEKTVDFHSPCGMLLLGRDTRETGPEIEGAVIDILRNILKTPFTSFDVLTTPQLHFLVAKANEPNVNAKDVHVDAYHEQLLSSLESLLSFQRNDGRGAPAEPQRVVVDCANGVGTLGMQRLLAYSQSRRGGDILSSTFAFELVNTSADDPNVLNEKCGADYAKQHAVPSQKMQSWPQAANSRASSTVAHFYCLDGDADRIVAFLHNNKSDPSWTLLDGDRIAILYALLLHKWLNEEQMAKIDVGVVQTAYANGASTEFIKEKLHIPVYIAATGVKNLHPVAHARDIGVYFEANGHGTVLFSDKFFHGSCAAPLDEIVPLITNLRGLFSQVCGDAIGDLLMCEVALRALNMSFETWAALYTDRPCKQVKVTVQHPKRITTTQDEQRALSPDGLQDEIDAAVSAALSQCNAARSFARPSGTEPVVRVYAEASTKEVCDSLSSVVCSVVEKFCN